MSDRKILQIPDIPEIPGFQMFVLWMDSRFSGLEQDVSGLVECVETGNGKPSLKAQIANNTKFRESIEDEKRDAKKARLSAYLALGVSLLLIVVNIVLMAAQIPHVAGGG